jgi:hypothetical protein
VKLFPAPPYRGDEVGGFEHVKVLRDRLSRHIQIFA